MLVVRVELWPHGDEMQAEIIARMAIGNLGKDDENQWMYNCRVVEEPNPVTKEPAKSANFNLLHDRRNSVWFLVSKVIEKYLYGNKTS